MIFVNFYYFCLILRRRLEVYTLVTLLTLFEVQFNFFSSWKFPTSGMTLMLPVCFRIFIGLARLFQGTLSLGMSDGFYVFWLGGTHLLPSP